MPPSVTYAITALGIILLIDLVRRHLRQRALKKRMPPGPPGLPLIGNAHQLTSSNWHRFTEWKDVYGCIFSLSIAGQPVIVLNNFSVTGDLIDRRSAIYSDRPRLIMLEEIMSRGMSFVTTRYNAHWRSMRKAANECLSQHATREYRPLQESHAYMLLSHLLKNPEQWQKHIRFAQTSLLFAVSYGLTPQELHNDPTIIEDTDTFVRETVAAAAPGSSLIDVFPWLLHLPRWLSPWKRAGDKYYTRSIALFTRLLNHARAKSTSAKTSHTISMDLMKFEQANIVNKEQSAWFCGAIYVAGQETSTTVVNTLILVMLLYPEKIRPAQEQIDKVVGRDRLPTAADINDLPLVHAIIQEVLRWRPPAPLSLPKRCMQTDHYKGYVIPEGTTVLENVWAMNHDPRYFDSPYKFEPARYLDNEGHLRDPIADTHGYSHASFGAGRRICVGKDLAMQGLLITASVILWGVDILPALDANGDPILPSPDAMENHGIVVRPVPFSCRILPREERVEKLVNDALEEDYILDI